MGNVGTRFFHQCSRTRDIALFIPNILPTSLFFYIRSSSDGQPEHLQLLSMEELIPGLQPLVLWMANSIELLHFIQHEVPQLLPWRQEQEDEGGWKQSTPVIFNVITAVMLLDLQCVVCVFKMCLCVSSGLLDSEMSLTRTACEEAMTVLEEVIMFTFQQSVYYLTKVGCHRLILYLLKHTHTHSHSDMFHILLTCKIWLSFTCEAGNWTV